MPRAAGFKFRKISASCGIEQLRFDARAGTRRLLVSLGLPTLIKPNEVKMKPTALFRSVMLMCALSLLGVFGCQKTSTSTDNGSPSGAENASPASSPSGSERSASNPASSNSSSSPVAELKSVFTPKPIVVKPGTQIVVTADQEVSSKTSNSGDQFDASVAEPIVVGDHVVIPKGARASGTVVTAKSAGRFKGNAELSVALTSVTVKGKTYPVKTSEVSESSKGRGKRTAEGAGGGAVVGALVGALAGGGKGAAIGAAAGGGAGTAGAAMTGQRDVSIRPESKLSFKLEDAVAIQQK